MRLLGHKTSSVVLAAVAALTLGLPRTTGADTDITGLSGAVSFGSIPGVPTAPSNIAGAFGSCVTASTFSQAPVLSSTSGGSLFSSGAGASLMSSISGGLGANLISIPGVSGGFNPGPMCMGRDSVDSSSVTCESGGGALVALQKSAAEVNAVLQCRFNKLALVPGMLNCLSSQATVLDNLIRSLKTAIAASFEKAHAYVSEVNGVIADRKQQIEQVDKRLMGDAPPGLRKVENELQAMVDRLYGGAGVESGGSMSGEIQSVKLAQDGITQRRSLFKIKVETEKTGLVNECFSSKSKSEYRCRVGGPIVSPREYLLCRVEQNAMLGADGRTIERDPRTQQNAQVLATNLEQLLTQIFADVPSSGRLPNDPQGIANTYDRPLQVFTAERVQADYGDRLAAFNVGGLNVSNFFLTHISQCTNLAQKEIDAKLKNKASSLYMEQEGIKKEETRLATRVQTLLTKGGELYTKAMQSLTGFGEYRMNTAACDTTKPDTQYACVTDMGEKIKNLLNGDGDLAKVRLLIKGNDSQGRTNVVFECGGVRVCAATLERLKENLGTEVTRLKGVRSSFVAKFNASADTMLAEVSNQLGPAAASLKSQLQMMNSQLAILGATIDIPDIDGGDGKFDAESGEDMDGLYKMPQNLKKLIAANVDPKIPDLAGNNFTKALENLSKVAQDLSSKQSKTNEAMAAASATVAKCVKEEKQKKAQDIENKKNALQAFLPNCSPSQRGAAYSAINAANTSIAQLGGTGGSSTPNYGGMLAGGGNGRMPSSNTGEQSYDDVNCAMLTAGLGGAVNAPMGGMAGGAGGFDASSANGIVQGIVNSFVK